MPDIWTLKDEHSYATFVGVLSNIYMKAHACGGRYQATIVISPSMTVSYRDQPESSEHRLRTIAARMPQPRGGLDLSIKVSTSPVIDGKVGLKHPNQSCWPISADRQPRLLTLNMPPAGIHKARRFDDLGIHADIEMDYWTPVDDVLNALESSRVHVSYQGGTAWLSVAMGVPTLIVHPGNVDDGIEHKARLFGQALGQINILQDGKIRVVRRHPCEQHVSAQAIKEALRDYP